MIKIVKYWAKLYIALILGFLPFGLWYPVYKRMQLTFGGLKKWDPTMHFNRALRLRELNALPEGFGASTFIELGTGGSLFHPILLYVWGAPHIYTIDVVDLLDEQLIQRSINFMTEQSGLVLASVPEAERDGVRARLLTLKNCKNVRDVCKVCSISHLVNADLLWLVQKVTSDYPQRGVFIFSNDVLEHVRPEFFISHAKVLKMIPPDRVGYYHYIDVGDHFYHGRSDHYSLKFLDFSDGFWALVSRNSYHYCNRLRPSFFIELFSGIHAGGTYVLHRIDGSSGFVAECGIKSAMRNATSDIDVHGVEVCKAM